MAEKPVIIVSHFDVHGSLTAALASVKFSANEIHCRFPDTGPENVVDYLRNLIAAAPSQLQVYVIDIPVNLKAPASFVQGLEELAMRHEIIYYDHHESSLQFLNQFQRVKAIYIGPSAYDLTRQFLPDNSSVWENIAIIAAIGDRDPAIIQRGLWSQELQNAADGFDVLVRRDPREVINMVISDPSGAIQQAIQQAQNLPVAGSGEKIGVVSIAGSPLPEGWGPKALERLAFRENSFYAVGIEYVSRLRQWICRVIARWDVVARNPQLPLPGHVAKELFPTRNVIGHPSAPSIAATSADDAREIAYRIARELADRAFGPVSPRMQRFINEYEVGRVLTEILMEMRNMYREYLDLKKKQVELLEEMRRRDVRAD
ncbi:MAG: hypothetical protein ACTSXX_13100 [Candidatus Baldrarchaeia archaeon]